MSRKILVHVITGLSTGGAEMMLYKLLAAIDGDYFEPAVVSLLDKGTIGPRIEALGIPVFTLNMSRGVVHPGHLFRLRRLLRRLRPDIVQGWMYHGNIAATLGSWSSRSNIPVIWNIRQSLYDMDNEPLLTRLVIRGGAMLSSAPERIVYNSKTSAEQHEGIGFRASARRLIANGFDTEQFRPDPVRRASIRHELGIPDDALVIGMIGRYHPMKDHGNFLRAAKLLLSARGNVRFVLAGRDVDTLNPAVVAQINALGLNDNVILLGERTDVAAINAALDIACSSSSRGEAFPNVIGEAMACEVPCVVTDVGDSSWIVGDTGLTVQVGDPAGMAAAWERLAAIGCEDRRKLGEAARNRIVRNFSLKKIAEEYEQLYRSYCSSK